jgi:NRPS condensation-like uncharacterized protein
LGNAPQPDTIRTALDHLQTKLPLLRARITRNKNKYWFEEDPENPQIPLNTISWNQNSTWEAIAETEMAHSFNKGKAPLIRATFVQRGKDGDLILTAHHSIIDGVSGIDLAEQLLSLCAGYSNKSGDTSDIPTPEKLLPPSHQGLNKIKHMTRFAFSQFKDEISFWLKNFSKRKPQVYKGGKGKVLSMTLPEELVNQLAIQSRSNEVTINSVLNAAQVLAVNRILYKHKDVRMATFTFADLRPFLAPPLSNHQLGGWVTLFRIFLDVLGDSDIWLVTKNLHEKIYQSINRGDKFSSFLASELLLKMMTGIKIRFGASALNYSGVIPLKNQYGPIEVLGVHGLVSGFDLAPEFSSQARIFNDKIIWDFIYLDTDMDQAIAMRLLDEIHYILQKAVKK